MLHRHRENSNVDIETVYIEPNSFRTQLPKLTLSNRSVEKSTCHRSIELLKVDIKDSNAFSTDITQQELNDLSSRKNETSLTISYGIRLNATTLHESVKSGVIAFKLMSRKRSIAVQTALTNQSIDESVVGESFNSCCLRGLLLELHVTDNAIDLLQRKPSLRPLFLLRWDSFLVLNLGLDVFSGVTGFNIQNESHACRSLHENLHRSRVYAAI